MSSASQLVLDAETQLAWGDVGGAAETYVEAVEAAVREFAEGRGWPTEAHHDLLVAGGNLPGETEDQEFLDLFAAYVGLTFNDTRGWTAEELEFYRHQVKRLVEKLVALTSSLAKTEE
jgi:hypothetical protein